MQNFSWRALNTIALIVLRPWRWQLKTLELSDFSADPMTEFHKWFAQAKKMWWVEFPDAMTLCTVDEEGCPEGRMVLLKELDQQGFVFYTNFNSRKGRSLIAKPEAGLTFYWEAMHRQVKVQGIVEKVTSEEADLYFATRPRGSQIGAWASLQSEPLMSRKTLEDRVTEFENKFASGPVPRPPHWGGFRVIPKRVEFLMMRLSRLHDRFVYTLKADRSWQLERYYP